jgi:hypothetical protein
MVHRLAWLAIVIAVGPMPQIMAHYGVDSGEDMSMLRQARR